MNLVTVQGNMQLDERAAAAWGALKAEVHAATGIVLTISSPAGAWRSEALVLDMWLRPSAYGATKGTAKPRELGGPGSVHETGLCIDIWNWALVPDLEHRAASHGFHRTIAAEPWHYQYTGTAPAGADPTPIGDEIDMATLDELRTLIRQQVAEIVQREERYRLYKNMDTGQFIAISYDAPAGREVLYIKNPVQLMNLRTVYQLIGDTAEQAIEVPGSVITTLIGLARGTDGVYRP